MFFVILVFLFVPFSFRSSASTSEPPQRGTRDSTHVLQLQAVLVRELTGIGG